MPGSLGVGGGRPVRPSAGLDASQPVVGCVDEPSGTPRPGPASTQGAGMDITIETLEINGSFTSAQIVEGDNNTFAMTGSFPPQLIYQYISFDLYKRNV